MKKYLLIIILLVSVSLSAQTYHFDTQMIYTTADSKMISFFIDTNHPDYNLLISKNGENLYGTITDGNAQKTYSFTLKSDKNQNLQIENVKKVDWEGRDWNLNFTTKKIDDTHYFFLATKPNGKIFYSMEIFCEKSDKNYVKGFQNGLMHPFYFEKNFKTNANLKVTRGLLNYNGSKNLQIKLNKIIPANVNLALPSAIEK